MLLQDRRPAQAVSSNDERTPAVVVQLIAALALLSITLFTTSCSTASSQNLNSGKTPANVGVQVQPPTAEVQSKATLQLTATVTGTNCTGVTWQTTAGSISSTGLFKAPAASTTTQAVITAVSLSNAACTVNSDGSSANATITIVPANTSNSGLAITTTSLPPATVGLAFADTMTASGGSQPYQWSSTGLPAGLTLGSSGTLTGTPTQSGAYSFQIQVTDAVGHTANWDSSTAVASAGSYDGPAELPLAYVQTAMSSTPAPGSTIQVAAGGDLQTALNTAECGDTVELQAGATFTGMFTIPAKTCDDQHWIIIRTNSPDASLPPEGVRLTPCYAGVSSLPGRPAFNCTSTQNVLSKIVFQWPGNGPIQFASGANHYRFLGLEITRLVGTGYVGSLISTQKDNSVSEVIIDRSWVHGTSQDDTATGVALGGLTSAAVINSFLTDMHCTSKVGACVDSHAIAGGCETVPGGPYAIVNNFIEASGENILFGGGAATSTPADIQISQNHFFKPLIWMAGASGFIGGEGGNPFVVKNHLELKNAQRVLVEDNIFEDNWGGFTQIGHSILLTPKNQYQGQGGNVCPLCQVTDITVRYSTISHVGAGIGMANAPSDGGGQASAGERYSIHDVVIDDISVAKYDGGGGAFFVGNGWNADVLNSILINHVTAFPDPAGHLLLLWNDTTNPTMWGFDFTNNIVNATNSPFANGNGQKTSCAFHTMPIESLPACFTTYSFTNNVLPAIPSSVPVADWPAKNFFPATDTAVQFVNYNNGDGGNYQLAAGSPYKNAGSDGKDPGADITLVNAGIAGVY